MLRPGISLITIQYLLSHLPVGSNLYNIESLVRFHQ